MAKIHELNFSATQANKPNQSNQDFICTHCGVDTGFDGINVNVIDSTFGWVVGHPEQLCNNCLEERMQNIRDMQSNNLTNRASAY